MNRFNFGNQITNGMQILSVAGTTTAGFINSSKQRRINDLSSGLNNLDEDELMALGEMRAENYRKQIAASKEGGGEDDGGFTDIDSIMSDSSSVIRVNSAQSPALIQKTNADVAYSDEAAEFYKRISSDMTVQERRAQLAERLAAGQKNKQKNISTD